MFTYTAGRRSRRSPFLPKGEQKEGYLMPPNLPFSGEGLFRHPLGAPAYWNASAATLRKTQVQGGHNEQVQQR
jgi:hypothetical protein